MQIKRLIFLVLFLFYGVTVLPQQQLKSGEADLESYRMYSENKWNELLQFGKNTITSGIDFPLLRMRIGYAAFMLGNYSECLKHYQSVLAQNADNATALIYCYWSSYYLNNLSLARFYAGKMSPELRATENIRSALISGVNLEYSFKSTDVSIRGNAQYVKMGMNVELGHQLHLENNIALYNQIIQEPLFTAVTNNTNIQIAQKEFVTKLVYTASEKYQLIAGFHYLHTPFNNFLYRNYIGSAGVKYMMNYVQVQGFFQAGRIRDSTYTQANAVISYFPKGNTNLYLVADLAVSKEPTLSQTLGFRFNKKISLEGRITGGAYYNLLSNDALYVYDDIDLKKLRIGGSLYYMINKGCTFQCHYAFDRKELYQRTGIYFNQHSITGGIQWNF